MQLEVALLNELFEADCYKTLISLIVCIKLNDDKPANDIMVLIATQTAKAQMSLCKCTNLPEPSLFTCTIYESR